MRRGSQVHHIVEAAAARAEGYPNSWIDAPDNLVLIPTMKHWEVTGWFMTRQDDFGGLSPREYLIGKDWETRREVGLKGLRGRGLLK